MSLLCSIIPWCSLCPPNLLYKSFLSSWNNELSVENNNIYVGCKVRNIDHIQFIFKQSQWEYSIIFYCLSIYHLMNLMLLRHHCGMARLQLLRIIGYFREWTREWMTVRAACSPRHQTISYCVFSSQQHLSENKVALQLHHNDHNNSLVSILPSNGEGIEGYMLE